MNDNDSNVFSCGFSTARGSTISVSDKALSKAKNSFTEELKDIDDHEEIYKSQNKSTEFDVQVSNFGFQTAGGRSINVTNEALSKAETLFSNEIVENVKGIMPSLQCNTTKNNSANIFNKALLKEQQLETTTKNETYETSAFMINDGFKTAGGKHLVVTEQALQKAERLICESTLENANDITSPSAFKITNNNLSNASKHNWLKNDLKDIKKFEDIYVTENETDTHELQNIDYQTASGRSISVTKEALLKSNALLYEDISEDPESSALTKSFQKRKIKEVDNDDTSLNKAKSQHFKKLRISNEIQVQRIVHKNSLIAEEDKNQKMTSISSNVLIVNANKLVDSTLKNETNGRSKEGNNNLINSLNSHEIVASTVAVLADEKDAFDSYSSSIESKENEEIPSSPVIGGQFISRKRRSINSKRNTNVLRNIENESLSTSKESNDEFIDPSKAINKKTKCLIEKQESMNKTNKYDNLDSNEFDDTQLMMEFINQSENILEKRFKAISEQEKQISLKRKCKPKPKIGTLYLYRKTNHENRVSWREISIGNKPVPCTKEELIERKLPLEILDITADNAITFRFRCTDFYGQDVVQNNIEGIKLDDGACIVLDENGYVGITEIKRAFLASPGVDPSLLFDGWIENHYKWIVWKLASMDRIKLGSITLPRALTPARVMMELKYRYDREIDRSERSAIRKILEKDDVASKRMVLCVESITEHDNCTITNSSTLTPSKRVILTDGWYSIQACIDQAMIKNVIDGKIKEGTKLLTYGSELLNCDQGCSPLEAPKNVCLKMHTNSTRRARWDTKLGYVAPSGPFYVKLKTIMSNGGLIGKIKVLITRVYPMLYCEKTPSGNSIFRNARCEEKANIAYEEERRSTIEAFYTKAEKCFSTKRRKSSANTDSIDLALSDLDEEYEKQEYLSKQEFEQLENNYRVKKEKFRQKLESQLQETLPPPRQVTPLLKIRIAEEETSAILSIWSPSEEITDILKEGNVVSIRKVTPLGKRGNEVQLSANRGTIFNQVNIFNISYPRRTYTPLCDVNKPTFAPVYGELDTVGVIVGIRNEPHGMKHFEAVYLAYPDRNVQSSYISILFWHGIVSHGYAEILTVGSFVACSNLEWRRATSWNIPMTYCTERSTFTRNPRQSHLQQPFEELKYSIKDISTYITTCAAEISKEAQKKSRVSDSYKNNLDKTSLNESLNSDTKFTNDVYREQRRYSLPNPSVKLTTVQERLERLERYGEPPNLPPIVPNNNSKRSLLEFQSPIRSANREQAKNRRSLNTNFAENSRIKAPENLPKLRNYKGNENEPTDFQLPSLQQKKKAWKDVDDTESTWDQTSAITSTSYSSEIENIATRKVLQQWETIENTLYEDGNQVTQAAVLDECIQWRTQIPHLRIVGKNPLLSTKAKYEDFNINYNRIRSSSDFQNEEIFSEHSVQIKERKSSSKRKLRKSLQDEIFNILYEHVISELFPNKENETDLLCDNFNDVLQIHMAPVHSNKGVAKSTNWFEETISLEKRFSNSKCEAIEDHTMLIQKETPRSNMQEIQKRYNNATYNNRIKREVDIIEDKLSRPPTSRNKLGTVFNEKIVVSPVPYVLSTRESFSTVKTTPIKFMAKSVNVSTFQGSNRNIFKNSGKNSALVKSSNYQSTWHTPVSSAMWPKNMKLAPLDTSRLTHSKNRSLTSSVPSLRNRKPLSPISRPILPISAQTTHNNNEGLEIQGKHITPGQSPKLSIPGTSWNYNAGSTSKKKRNHLKMKS